MQKRIGAVLLAAAALALINNGRRGQQEVWSDGANTLRFCTMAHGIVDRLQGFTNEVC